MQQEVERELVLKCRAGDARFYEPLVRAYEPQGQRSGGDLLRPTGRAELGLGSREPSPTRPIGWLLVMVGTVAWVAHFVYEYFTSAAPSWEKMATNAVVIGVLLLFASVIHDRYRELLTDPYRHVER